MTEGEASDHVIVLLVGRAKVSSYTAEGKEVVLAVRGPGDLLGELSAFDGEPALATVSALEPIEALIIPSERFTRFLEDHPRLAILLLQNDDAPTPGLRSQARRVRRLRHTRTRRPAPHRARRALRRE